MFYQSRPLVQVICERLGCIYLPSHGLRFMEFKSFTTNVLATLCILLGYLLPEPFAAPLRSVGLFALSGAITNWLAIHMLFEKVPLLYGSGVIPARFEEFKSGIRDLIMTQFFTRENVERFFAEASGSDQHRGIDLHPIIEGTDWDPAFDTLVKTVKASPFGSMLGMFGGDSALEPLRQPFATNMKASIKEISSSPAFQSMLQQQMAGGGLHHEILEKVEGIVTKRLDELSPHMVKQIVQDMIRQHLGWLVVWGGVFGGAIGLAAHYLVQ